MKKSLLIASLFLAVSATAHAFCTNCMTGKETYPITWNDNFKANLSNQGIRYDYGTSEYGENLSGADLFNTTREFYGDKPQAPMFRYKNYFNTRMPYSSILSAPGVDKFKLTVTPVKDANGSVVMADNTGSNFQHANMRCNVIGNALMRNVTIYDVDMTDTVHLGVVDYYGATLEHVNLTGVAFVQHPDGSLILKNVPVGLQPTIHGGFKWDTLPGSNVKIRFNLIKYRSKEGWYWSPYLTSAQNSSQN